MRALAAVLSFCVAGCQCIVLRDGPYPCNEKTGEDCGDAGLDGGGSDGGGAFTIPRCGDAWCWEHPRPFGSRTSLTGILELKKDDVWVTGSSGVVAHYDGKSWSQIPTGTSVTLWQIAGKDDHAIWMVGQNGFVLEWDGHSVVHHDAGSGTELRAIALNARRELYAVGINGVVLHYDSDKWSRPITPNPGGSLYAAAGFPDGGMLAMGNFALQFAGNSWSLVPRPADGGVADYFYAPAPNDIWACGVNGIFRNTTGDYSSAANWVQWDDAGVGVNAVFALDSHVFWGPSSNGLYESTNPVPITNRGINAISGTAEDDIWAIGNNAALLHRSVPGAFFDDHAPDEVVTAPFYAVAMLPGGNAWVAGEYHTMMMRDGGTWSRVRTDGSPNSGAYLDVWTMPGAPVIAVGQDPVRLAYWDAGTQRMAPVNLGFTGDMYSVWGSSPSDIWAVGQYKQIFHNDGGSWAMVPQPAECPWFDTHFDEVWGTGPQDIWLVANHGCILHWTGASFVDESMVDDESLVAIGGVGTDVWISNRDGRIWRHGGTKMWAVETNTQYRVRSLFGYQGDMYSAGEFSSLLKRDSTGNWRRMVVHSDLYTNLSAIAGVPGEGMLVVGDSSTVLYHEP